MAKLSKEPSDPQAGYITAEDMRFVVHTLLSAIAGIQSTQGAFLVADKEGALPTVHPDGALVLAKDTGQWFIAKSGAWARLGLDVTTTAGNLGAALARTDGLQDVVNNLFAQTPLAFDPQVPYQPDDVVVYQDAFWIAEHTTVAGDTPGSSANWAKVSIETLHNHATEWHPTRPVDPTDDNKHLLARGGDATWEAMP